MLASQAFVKARGDGLGFALNQVEFELEKAEPHQAQIAYGKVDGHLLSRYPSHSASKTSASGSSTDDLHKVHKVCMSVKYACHTLSEEWLPKDQVYGKTSKIKMQRLLAINRH